MRVVLGGDLSRLGLGPDLAGDDTAQQDECDEAEADRRRDVNTRHREQAEDAHRRGEDELEAHPKQDDRQPLVETSEHRLDRVEQEVQRPEPQDRHRVRTEDQEGDHSDRERRRDGVDREQEVGTFQDDQADAENCHQHAALAVTPLADDEPVPPFRLGELVVARDRQELGCLAVEPRLRDVLVLVVAGEHLVGGPDHDQSEGNRRPAEVADERRTSGDEHEAQDQGSEDAPEQQPVLERTRNGEERQDDTPDEHVVDGQRVFDEPRRVVETRGGATVLEPDPQSEDRADADVHERLHSRRTDRRHLVLLVQDEQVDHDQRRDDTNDDHPFPERNTQGKVAIRRCQHETIHVSLPGLSYGDPLFY